MTNIIHARFSLASTSSIFASGLWQYDYGQILKFEGLELPTAYETHFANEGDATSVTMIGDENGVQIPDSLLLTGKPVIAWVYLHTGENDGETEYKVTMPVKLRATPSNEEPTPVQQDTITQTIAALNHAVDLTDANVELTAQHVVTAQGYAEDANASKIQAGEYAIQAGNYVTQANTYAQQSQTAEQSALSHVMDAELARDAAQGYADDAEQSAHESEAFADDAQTSADRAEQAAASAGYMFFHIDENGDLIYNRTNNTAVDFYLQDGDLYVRGVA